MISAGTFKARATGACVLGTSKNKGTPYLEFYLAVIGGEHEGALVRWTGYFTENTSERSIQALQTCGWQGEDLSEFSDGALHGLDAKEVEIVVEIETYQSAEGEDRHAPRVAWINRPGGFLNTESAMNDDAAKAFGASMRGLVLTMKKKNPVKDTGTAFPHGANAPTQAAGNATGQKAF